MASAPGLVTASNDSSESNMEDISNDKGGGTNNQPSCKVGGEMLPPSPVSREQLHKRIESLQQQNRVLKVELETYKLRVKALQEENRSLRQASVHIQAKAEQEEEFISNTLLKKIQELKKEKENLALNYEQEEECLTNDLSRKLDQLRQEKIQLEHTLEQEQECLVNKLMRRIEKLETETSSKQNSLDSLRREKIELENTLEQEQEALVNKLWKRMHQLENEKRSLQQKLEKPDSVSPPPPSNLTLSDFDQGGDTASNLANNIRALKMECMRLKKQWAVGRQEHERTMAAFAKEEREIREENLRLQRRLQLEMERREALCRHLSESESSLEMEEERAYNEMSHQQVLAPATGLSVTHRTRTVSSPVPLAAGCAPGLQQPQPMHCTPGRPISPGLNYGERRDLPLPVVAGRTDVFTPPAINRLHHSFNSPPGVAAVASPSPPPPQAGASRRPVPPDRFVRPPPVTSPGGSVHVSIGGPSSAVSLIQKVDIGDDVNKPPSSPMDTSESKS